MRLKTLISVVATAAAVTLSAAPAAAQSVFFDWSGGSNVGGAGKQTVKFSPTYRPGEVVVSFGDRLLYFVHQSGAALAYPIAIPREQSRWQGTTSVTQKRENPGWTPTPSMRAENPKLPSWVPGGHPMNPLGVRALYLGSSTYRIHGTDAPWTIGSAVSKGCIRMYNQDVVDLYPRVPMGAKVTVTWNRFSTTPVAAAAEEDDAADKKKKARVARGTVTEGAESVEPVRKYTRYSPLRRPSSAQSE